MKKSPWGGASIYEADWRFIENIVEAYSVRSVLEFGCGLSTCLFVSRGCDVVSFETNEEYFNSIVNNLPLISKNVRFWDGISENVIDGHFDLAFVDGPIAYNETVGKRDVSTKLAARHSDLVIVHDASRDAEQRWQKQFLEPLFRLESKGGHDCNLWVRCGSRHEELNRKAIDIHAHASQVIALTWSDSERYPLPAELIEDMDSNEIKKTVLMSMVSPECREQFVTSEQTWSICEEFKDRFVPFIGIDPRMLKNEIHSNFRELLEYYKALGFKGVGEYAPNIPVNDPLNINLFKQIESAGLPITIHFASQIGGTYGCYDAIGLPLLENVLRECPGLTVLAHSPVFWSEISSDVTRNNRHELPTGKVTSGRVVELMRAYPNLHGDLSALSGHNAIARDYEFGIEFICEFSDRLCFGTDSTKPHQRTPLMAYLKKLFTDGRLSNADYDKIMWKNAERLLGL